ncbi:hypothetical protein HC024_00360 [Methylococcaceae bacterium WWC4]|nr:hypothetical protein [Methylococcaceae bacterium WWC4]
MSAIDKNLYADAEEIGAAIDLSAKAVRDRANKEKWIYEPEKTRSRHPKKWFEIAKLPIAPDNIYAAVVGRRMDLRLQHEQNCNVSQTSTVSTRHDSPAMERNGRSIANSQPVSGGVSARLGSNGTLQHAATNPKTDGRTATADAAGIDSDGRVDGSISVDCQRGDSNQSSHESVARQHSKSLVEGSGRLIEIVPGVFGNQSQLDVHRARQNLIDYLRGGKGAMARRIAALNTGYQDGILSTTLTWSFEHAWEKRRANTQLTAKTYENWCKDFAARGHYAPLKRQKDFSIKPWHPVALALRQRPQGSSKQWVYDQLVEQLGADALPDYTNVCRWLNEKASQADQDKGRYSGSQLRARRFYQHRTAEGLAPASLMHADGWNSHFTAPHPVTGEFVTYEIWHAHDVATRYAPQPGIGLTENWQVILKCVENFVRELGIPARVQTDSTKVVKGSDRFTKAVHSLEERLGMTWTHPVTVGNSQANGIAENFNTSYLDKRSRELATYQNKNSMDELSFKRIRKLTHDMVKAAGAGNLLERDKIKRQIEKIGKGLVFESYGQAIAWIEGIFNDYNDRPHAALPRVVDAVTGKRRHQTPREALQEHIAHGWEPVALAEHELIAEFRPHVTVTIRRDTVTPWGGMRYYHPVLATMNDKPVIVAYDLADYHHVWVKDIDGTPICTADFVEATRYHAMSAQMAEDEKRAKAALKRLDNKRDTVIDRIPGEVLTLEAIPVNELPGMEIIAKKIEIRNEVSPGMAATIPEDDRSRHLFWREWQSKAATGTAIPESLRPFMSSYPNTAKCRSWEAFFNAGNTTPLSGAAG